MLLKQDYLLRHMHRRIPAWKLKLCVEAINARPIDLARIAVVTDIQFVTEELVEVAAQCLIDIAKEMESMDSSVGATAYCSSSSKPKREGIYGSWNSSSRD